MSSLTCPQCGARLAEGAERCDLCGSPLPEAGTEPDGGASAPISGDDIPEPESPPVDETQPVDESRPAGDAQPAGQSQAAGEARPADDTQPVGVFCNDCGWKNPTGARFCSRCGAKLQAEAARAAAPGPAAGTKPAGLTAPSRAPGGGDAGAPADQADPDSPPAADSESDGLTRHVAVLIGISILIVMALYLVTVVSKQRVQSPSAQAAVEAPAEVRSAAVIDEYEAIPIAERHASTVDSLRNAAASADGEAAQAAARELVDFFVEIGRVDRAAIEQQRLARRSDAVADWRRAGELLYEWMESVNSERKTDVALLTIEAFKNVLDREPGDLDARADLGWAYQYDPQNPMEAIRQTNLVLEEDPDHLAANYNRAVFLLRINRVRDAVEQFERVADLAEADSPYERQAEAWIRTIRQQQEAER